MPERRAGLFAISVAAEMVEMQVQNLRVYERRGLLEPARTPGGTRLYSHADIERLHRIRHLLAAGLNLVGIGEVLRLEEENARLREQVRRLRGRGGRTGPPGRRARPRTPARVTRTGGFRVLVPREAGRVGPLPRRGRYRAGMGEPEHVVPVYFLSDSTGISAETMGNALLIQFPELVFERTTVPFISTPAQARTIVARLDAAMDGPVTPLVFCTAAEDEVRRELHRTRAPVIDFFDMHMNRVEGILGRRGERQPSRLHGVGDIKRYNSRMAAVEFTIEHDDGQSLRALEKADAILLAPSRCGKTPTSMYLALQHGLYVANYPLVEEDLEASTLPAPVADLLDRCYGITTSVDRLTRVRNERRPGSRYSSAEQCRWELRRSTQLFEAHGLPVIDSSSRSVEEMATLIVQTMRSGRPDPRGRVRPRTAGGAR